MKKEGKPNKRGACVSGIPSPRWAAPLRQALKGPDKLGAARLRRRDTAVCADARALIQWRLGHQRFLPLAETRKSKEGTARSPRFGAYLLGPILGPKAMGGGSFPLWPARLSPKKFLQPIPQAPEHPNKPNKPGKPDIADTPDE